MRDPEPFDLLVVSDLHLSEGRRGGTSRFSRNEDFFFDAEFARFLRHHAARSGARWHLVIAGDFLDLLQVVATPSPQGSGDDGYGLPCGEDESVFKLQAVAAGHPEVFEALAAFVAEGHRLTILKGNHDVELHYPRVQDAFLAILRAAFGRIASPPPSASAASIGPAAIRFADWFHHEEGLVWIEHGSQYDGWNTFRTFLSPLLPDRPGASRPDDVDLPLGSLFVRYLFNRIESVEPFADNIKPVTRFVGWLLKRHPVTAVRFLLGDGRHMLDRLRRALAPVPAGGFRRRDDEHGRRLADLARASGIREEVLADIDALRAKSVLEETAGFWPTLAARLVRLRLVLPLVLVIVAAVVATGLLAALQLGAVLVPRLGTALASVPALRPVLAASQAALAAALVIAAAVALAWMLRPEERPGTDALLAPANAIAARLGVRHVIMGHTHDAQLLALDGGRGVYLNTGTWTKVFSEEERLIRSDVEFVFVEGIRDGGDLKLRLMEWDDAAGEPRVLKLFET